MCRKKKYHNLRWTVFWLLLFLACIIMEFPLVEDALSNIRQIGSVADYQEKVEGMRKDEIEEEKERVRNYNQNIYEEQMEEGFHYQGPDVTDREYESLLSSEDQNGANIMGFIEIPDIGVYLPVGHGTQESMLQYAAGHMYGSSLPLGGKNTNAIIAGHTGLATARLFTDVKTLEKGAEVRIHVLDEIHRYRLVRKKQVAQGPDETPLLQMEKGKDELTLYTCSPYGVNDHRIIERFERVYPDLSISDEAGEDLTSLGIDALIRLILCAALPAGIVTAGLVDRHRRKKKNLQRMERR